MLPLNMFIIFTSSQTSRTPTPARSSHKRVCTVMGDGEHIHLTLVLHFFRSIQIGVYECTARVAQDASNHLSVLLIAVIQVEEHIQTQSSTCM